MGMSDKEWFELVSQARAKYPWLVKWGQQLGSYDYYIDNQAVEAMKDGAPFDAVYKRDGKWVRLQHCAQATQDAMGFICI